MGKFALALKIKQFVVSKYAEFSFNGDRQKVTKKDNHSSFRCSVSFNDVCRKVSCLDIDLSVFFKCDEIIIHLLLNSQYVLISNYYDLSITRACG